jgi:hypothetical protein
MGIEKLGSLTETIFSGRSTSRIALKSGGMSIKALAPRDVGIVLASREALEDLEVEQAASDLEPVRVKPGDVIVTARGTLRAAVALEEHAGVVATANLVVVRLRDPLLCHVLAAYLRAPSTARRLQARAIGTATVGFGTQDLKNLEIDLPKGDELAALNELVSMTDRYTAAAQRAIDARRDLAQGLVTKALDEGRRT